MRRSFAIARRHYLAMRRDPAEWIHFIWWPSIDAVLFGALARSGAINSHGTLAKFILGILFVHVLAGAEIGISTAFFAEGWSWNVLNIMVTPITEPEWLTGLMIVSMARALVSTIGITVIAFALFAFHVTSVGFIFIPSFLIAIVTGWAIGIFAIGLVLRFGPRAELFTWTIIGLLFPTSGIFFPVEQLPLLFQLVSKALPTTYMFRSLIGAVDGHGILWHQLAMGGIVAVLFVSACIAYANAMLKGFRARGYIKRYAQ